MLYGLAHGLFWKVSLAPTVPCSSWLGQCSRNVSVAWAFYLHAEILIFVQSLKLEYLSLKLFFNSLFFLNLHFSALVVVYMSIWKAKRVYYWPCFRVSTLWKCWHCYQPKDLFHSCVTGVCDQSWPICQQTSMDLFRQILYMLFWDFDTI